MGKKWRDNLSSERANRACQKCAWWKGLATLSCFLVVLIVCAFIAFATIEIDLLTHVISNTTTVYDNDTVLVNTARRNWCKSVSIYCSDDKHLVTVYTTLCSRLTLKSAHSDLLLANVTIPREYRKILGQPLYLLPKSIIVMKFTVTEVSNYDGEISFYVFDLVKHDAFLNNETTDFDAILFQRISTELNQVNLLSLGISYTSYYFVAVVTDFPITFDFSYTVEYKYFSVRGMLPSCVLSTNTADHCSITLPSNDFESDVCLLVHSIWLYEGEMPTKYLASATTTSITTVHEPDYFNAVSANLLAVAITLLVVFGIFIATVGIIKFMASRNTHKYVQIHG